MKQLLAHLDWIGEHTSSLEKILILFVSGQVMAWFGYSIGITLRNLYHLFF